MDRKTRFVAEPGSGRRMYLCMAAICILSGMRSVYATDYTYTGRASLEIPIGDSKDWFDPQNWSPIGVPSTADTAAIGSFEVIASSAVTVNGLTLNGDRQTGAATIHGTITVTGAVQSPNGQVFGTLIIPVGVTLTLPNNGSLILNGGDGQGVLNNGGTVTCLAGSVINLRNGATPSINNSGTFDVQSADSTQYIFVDGSGATNPVLHNTGMITKSVGTGTPVFSA